MFRKTFVSIYFLPDRILLLRLSANKKKIKKFAEVEFPPELIKNYRIQDQESLSKILSSAWKKFGIREKVVGLIVPEISTFTKYFKLPVLSASEIDEAVRWQAQEYLPNGLDNVILDWKIAERNATGVEVMTISIEREVLSEYIKVVEMAGLLPMKVETPSVCLLRYSKDEEGGILTIYSNLGETILVLSDGEKIIGSSIQHTDNVDEILGSAAKMLNHYSDVKVEKVLLGGDEVELKLEKTALTLKKKVQVIEPEIEGLNAAELQKNLIPISLQLEDAEQPSDPHTLNLLPTYLVEKYKSQKVKNQVWSITLTITLFVWISFFVTLVAYLYMNQSINGLKDEITLSDSVVGESNPLEEIESINTVSKNVLKIKNATVLPQIILNNINSSRPAGVSLEKYELDLDKGEVGLQGFAIDRLTLIKFKENLEEKVDFESVEIPISSFEAENNLEFNLSFSYIPIKSTVKEKPIKVNPSLLQ